MSYLNGNFSVGGYPQDGATANLYPSSVFTSPPSGGNLSSTGTALPNSSNLLATTTTGPQHGSNGAYRFAVASSGAWWVGISWNGYNEWFFHSLPGSSPATLMDYGAVGDGVADDTAAVQAAALVNARIRVPIGTYRITDTIDLNGAYFVGDGWGTGNSTPKAKFLPQNLGTKPAFRTTQANTLSRTAGAENIYVQANSWDATSGCLGYGFEVEQQITLRNVYCQGFKKSNLWLHHDANENGPYESLIENFYSAYAGQHGVVVGTGANTVTFVNLRSFWSGAPSFGVAPSTSGIYSGFYVDYRFEGNPGGVYPAYVPQDLRIIGGNCSYNSMYGWDFSCHRDCTVFPGYGEQNKAGVQARVASGSQYCNWHFNALDGHERGILLNQTYTPYQQTNACWIGGMYLGDGGGSGTNSASGTTSMLENLDIRLYATPAGDLVHIRPLDPTDPTNPGCQISTFQNAFLKIGANTHTLTISGNVVSLPGRYYHNGRLIDQNTHPDFSGTYPVGSVYWNTAPTSGSPAGWMSVTAGPPTVWMPFGVLPNARSTTAVSGTMAVTDLILLHNASAGTVTLPSSPIIGQIYRVKDVKGDAAANNLTIVGGNATLIDAGNTVVISANYGSKAFVFDGAAWWSV